MNQINSESVVGSCMKSNEFSNLLGPPCNSEPPDTIYLYGDAATGKTFLVKKCLEQKDYSFAFVNCVESYSTKHFFENIINKLAGHVMCARNSYQPYMSCGSMMDFVQSLQLLAEEKEIGLANTKSIIIVLDKCERLRSLNKNLISGFFKLREVCGLKTCVVFISSLPWSHFCTNEYSTEPITIYFEQYDQKQLHCLLAKKKPSHVSQEFYNNFVSLFLSIFFNATHDIKELQYQIQKNFEYYYKPVLDGELKEKDTSQLWKRSQVYFKKALRSLYLKVDNNMDLSEVESLTSVSTQALIMELPFYSKYILIAAYIASYNSAVHDKRLFQKHSGKQKKSGRAKAEPAKQHLLGPRPFGLQRLFAIVSSILDDEKFTLNADIFVEVGSLVQMKLLTQVSEDVLDCPTYKCNVGLQFVDVIARNVQFPIRKYLVDFIDN